MEPERHHDAAGTPAPVPVFSPFWPICLLAASVLVFLIWQVVGAARQHESLVSLGRQQAALAGQAAQTETQLQSLMMDLLQLAEQDEEARAIVTKYNIRFNPPAANAGALTNPPATNASARPAPAGESAVETPAAAAPQPEP